MKLALFFVVGAIGLFSLRGPEPIREPQDAKNQGTDSRTRLETFQARRGVVILRGFTTIGTVSGRRDTSIVVQCAEFLDAVGGKERGIAVNVKVGTRDESTSYVDYDEIDALIATIDYLVKVNKSVTHQDNFQADYRTKGDVLVSAFTSSEGGTVATRVSIISTSTSGITTSVDAHLSVDQLGYFREILTKAKARLDEIK